MFSLLMVDSDEELLSIFRQHSSSWKGVSVMTSFSEENAENMLAKEEIDMVISEYNLPGKDGLTLLRHIRARYGGTPFLLLTAYGSEELADEVSRYDITGYFKKKGDLEVLFNEIYGMVRLEIIKKERLNLLKIRESRCRSILESQTGFSIRIDPDMKLVSCNKEFSVITSFLPEELTGRDFSDFISEKDRGSFESELKNLTPEHPSTRTTIQMVMPHNSDFYIFWTEWSLTAAFDPGSNCVLIQGIGRDISRELEIAEREEQYLKNMEFLSHTAMTFLDLEDETTIYQFIGEKIHEIVPNSYIGVGEVDMQNHLLTIKAVAGDVDVLPIIKKKLGMDLIGFSFPILKDPSVQRVFQTKGPIKAPSFYHLFFQLFPEDKCRQVEEILSIGDIYAMGFSTREEVFGNVTMCLKNGSELKNPDFLEAFALQASVALLRLRTRKKLIESEKRYKAVVESQTDLIYRFGPDGTHIFANDAFYRYFNESQETVQGKKFIPDMPSDDFEALKRYLSSLTPDSPAGMMEIRTIMKDGTIRWQQVNFLAIYTPEDNLVEFQAVSRDITERKVAEEELANLYAELEEKVRERTKELMAVNNDLSMFSYSVAHDLRAPLRAIDGFSSLFLTNHGHTLTPEARRHIDMIRKNASTMNQLIDSIFTLSVSRQHLMNKVNIDMESITSEVLDELLSDKQDRQIKIKTGSLPNCIGDKVMIRQLLVNLFSNALKFSRSRDPATIEIGSVLKNGQNFYYIRDNGIGFDIRYADRIFEEFIRLNFDNEYEGTGIGLAIAKQIVERHGGRIYVESLVGKGSTFYFSLIEEKLV